MCRVSSTQMLQPSWLLPPSRTHKQTYSHTRAHTHTDWLVVRGGERAQPPSRMSTECFAFCALSDFTSLNAACRYDIYKCPPTVFTRPEGLSLALTPSLVLYISDTFQLCATHFLNVSTKGPSPWNRRSLTHAPRRLLHISLLSFLFFLHPLLFIDSIYGFC